MSGTRRDSQRTNCGGEEVTVTSMRRRGGTLRPSAGPQSKPHGFNTLNLQRLALTNHQYNMATKTDVSVAVLDDYGDLATEYFAKIPGLKVAKFAMTLDTSDPEHLKKQVERLRPFAVISTMRERTAFTQSLLASLPNLKLLLTSGPKNAAIDTSAADAQGVLVHGTMAEGSPFRPTQRPPGPDSTTQHTWALILALASNVAPDDYVVKRGGWQSGYVTSLGGKTLALVGLGHLGSQTAKIAVLAFGMKVIAWSASLTQDKADAQAEAAGLPRGSFRAVGKEELFREADVLSVHYVLSARSAGVVGAEDLARMKPTAMLVNTSRGPLIDERALHEALLQGQIKGAAMDVFWKEPIPSDSPWRTTNWGTAGSSQVLLSPHMGYVTEPVMRAWYKEQAENLRRWMDGEELYSKLDNSSYAP